MYQSLYIVNIYKKLVTQIQRKNTTTQTHIFSLSERSYIFSQVNSHVINYYIMTL